MNSVATTFATYADARQYLEPFVQITGLATTPHAALQRAKKLIALLGNPQDSVPVIHLAGTSGKGSTATILAALLHAHGLCVGLGLSPHVRHLLERIQIDGAPIAEAEFCRVLGEMVPTIATLQGGEWGAPSFFEILIALSYTLFAHAGVDVVVMETGLGGRYDATNTVTRHDKIALFTPIGYDHVEILGNTLAKIASQKAGIIGPHNRVLTPRQPTEAQEVIQNESEAQGATITVFDPEQAIHNLQLRSDSLTFDLHLPAAPAPMRALHLSLAGAHQAQNAALAVAAAQLFLHGRGRGLDESAVRHALAHIALPGRMEQRTWRGAQIILDGAHNPQKIKALCAALAALYPDRRFIFVVALKAGKEHRAIFAQLMPLAAEFYLTQFDNRDQGMPLQATPADELTTYLPQEIFESGAGNCEVPIHVVLRAADALRRAVESANARRESAAPLPVVVTGSLYLLAEIYAVLDEEPSDDLAQPSHPESSISHKPETYV
jgi:dihydrofolate synthase/folylpolyglutamate synthase